MVETCVRAVPAVPSVPEWCISGWGTLVYEKGQTWGWKNADPDWNPGTTQNRWATGIQEGAACRRLRELGMTPPCWTSALKLYMLRGRYGDR